jgi:hypothetical protein
LERVPLPNRTRAGAALYSNASIVFAAFSKGAIEGLSFI